MTPETVWVTNDAVRRLATGGLEIGGSAVRAGLTAEPRREEGKGRAPGRRSRGRRRARTEREVQDLGAMIARMLRALARRAEGGDLEGLVELVNLQPLLTGYQKRAARALVEQQGYSWAQLALRLGITKQSAHGRWGGE